MLILIADHNSLLVFPLILDILFFYGNQGTTLKMQVLSLLLVRGHMCALEGRTKTANDVKFLALMYTAWWGFRCFPNTNNLRYKQ